MQDKLNQIKELALVEIKEAKDSTTIDTIRVKYLGKKGELTTILRGMGSLSKEERPIVGKLANEVREVLEAELEAVTKSVKEAEKQEKLKNEVIDISMPGKKQTIGKNHPARSEQDTFYINDNVVLRTQTSPVQARVMEKQQPPIKMISPGKVFRSDAVDATHSPIFYQMEGLVIDKDITFADLKGTLELFAKKMFGDKVKTKFRPHHFPFTEPSAEMDATCFVCNGKGCKVCKGEGWIEILGCGMVHPEVLRNCGIDPEVYSGFAFGFGVDRMVMLKYGIDDIRLLYESDMRFLNQF